MKKIVLIFCFLLIGCTQFETLYVPIINHTDNNLYLSIDVNDNTVIKKLLIEKMSYIEKKIKVKIDSYNNIIFIFKLEEISDSNFNLKDILWFPGGGIISNSARGGFFVAMDIILDEDGKIKVLYSEDTFKYGLPYSHYNSGIQDFSIKEIDKMKEIQ